MVDWSLEEYLVFILFLFFLTASTYLLYSGLFTRVEVKTCEPAYGPLVVAYKTRTGPYKDAGDLFTESFCLLPHREQIGLYYDDPEAVSEAELRYAVGPILSRSSKSPPSSAEMEKMTKNGFRIAHLPKPNFVVAASFPFATTLSIYIAIFRVYPKLRQYIAQRNLCAYPAIEIYSERTIEFLMPLSRQDEFFVSEFQEEDVSVATTDVGSVCGGGGGEAANISDPKAVGGDLHDDDVFLRPKTPPRDIPPRGLADQENSDGDDASDITSTSSSFDDLAKELEEKERHS